MLACYFPVEVQTTIGQHCFSERNKDEGILIEVIKDLYYNKQISQSKIDNYLGLGSSRTQKLMKKYGMPARSNRDKGLRNLCNEEYFQSIDTEEKAYWLGFIAADGYIQCARKYSSYKVGISLTESDSLHLEKFSSAVGFTGSVFHYISKTSYKPNCGYCRISISSNKMATDLMQIGCYVKKTGKVPFPTSDVVPGYLLRHYVRGYFDGNGCITHGKIINGDKRDFRIKLCASKEFISGFLSWIDKPDIALEKRHKQRDENTYSITIGGSTQVLTILDLMYKDSTVYLQRKYDKYLQARESILKYYSRARR